MTNALTVEERLTLLETEFAQMKQATAPVQSRQNWIETISGSFKNDPEFGEILRLGREIRSADQAGNGDV